MCVCVLGRVFAVSCHLENFIIKLRVAAKDSRAGEKGEAGRGHSWQNGDARLVCEMRYIFTLKNSN